MEYFYITCSAASLAALIGWLLEKTEKFSKSQLLNIVVSFFVISTIAFWGWFFFYPSNIARDRIAARSVLVEAYTDGESQIDIVEGKFDVDTVSWGSIIPLPPFKTPPNISIYRSNATQTPEIDYVSTDVFKISISNSDLTGEWNYRARGELLRRIALDKE